MTRSVFRYAVAVLCCALVLSEFGAGCRRSENPFVVGIDLCHGRAWPGLKDELASFGFIPRFLETPEDFDRLNELGMLMICTEQANPAHGFPPDEIRAISAFVRRGGGLLCAGEAWSWTMKEYGQRSLEDFPLNQIGAELGFRVLDHSTGAPRNLSPALLAGMGEINRSAWWPSEIELSGKNPIVFISDERTRPMAGAVEYGRGRAAVAGSADLLKENPRISRNLLLFLSGFEDVPQG